MQAAQKQGRKELESKLRDARKEHGVLSELNKSLIANQKVWQDKVKDLEASCADKDETIKVRVMCDMVHLCFGVSATPKMLRLLVQNATRC